MKNETFYTCQTASVKLDLTPSMILPPLCLSRRIFLQRITSSAAPFLLHHASLLFTHQSKEFACWDILSVEWILKTDVTFCVASKTAGISKRVTLWLIQPWSFNLSLAYYELFINLKAVILQIAAGIWNWPFCWCWQPSRLFFFLLISPLYR